MTKHVTEVLRSTAFAIAVAASLLGSVGAGSAEGFTPEQRSACTPDAFRLCSSEIPNVSAITACMRKNRANLSPTCKALLPR